MTDEMMSEEAIDMLHCHGTNARGEPCEAPVHLVTDGFCPTHRPGGAEAQRARAALGGSALRAKLAGQAFEPGDLPPIQSLEDAKLALDAIRVAVLTRRVSHNEGSAAAKAIDSWVRTETAAITARLVNELRAELENKGREIQELRKQLSGGLRARRVS